MFYEVTDVSELYRVALYAGHISEPEYQRSVEFAESMASAAKLRPHVRACVVVIVESSESPPATIRRRLAAADASMPSCDFAFVTTSPIARAAMTAFAWLSPERAGRRRKVFASFDEALEWLVLCGAKAEKLTELYERVRRGPHAGP